MLCNSMRREKNVTQKTSFLATENLLYEREALHGLVDTLWKTGCVNCTCVYEMMSEATGKPNIHISDMTSEDMAKVVQKIQPMVAKHLNRICHCCKHGYKSTLGLYRCDFTGHFSLTNEEECNAFAGNDL